MGIQAFRTIAYQRAGLVGKILKLENGIQAAQLEIVQLRLQVAGYDEVLRAQGVDIDPDIYAPPRNPTPKKNYFAHGELIGTTLDFLRTERRPLTMTQIMNAIVKLKKAQWHTAYDAKIMRKSIKRQLLFGEKRGIVVKVGSVGAAHNTDAIWALPEYADVPWDAAEIEMKD